jgi:ligand-binding sensor domain-containing protein
MKKIQRLLPILFGCLIITVHAAEITFSPQNPQVEIGGKITLSVSGTSGEVTWFAGKGQISGTGTQVTYWAPEQVGTDVVTVLDGADNSAHIKIIILPKDTGTPSQENANWEVFTARRYVQAIVVSEDEKTLWVGTSSGLEQRDRATGELVRLFTNLDGLPSNNVWVLYGDSSGGLWIGTTGGLAYRSVSGEPTVYNTDNSDLPDNDILALYGDSSGGLWIGTWGGLAYRSVDDEWTVYNTYNTGLPSNSINALYGESSGGLWIGIYGDEDGLAYRSVGGQWTVYNTDNSDLPDNDILALYGDSSGGLWIGTWGGLAYRSVGGQWTVYNTDNSDLPDNSISALYGDSSGGLWIGIWGDGLAYRSIGGQWTVYNTENAPLPSNLISALYGDSSGGLWIGTHWDGLAYRSVGGEWTVYNTENAGLPDNDILALYGDSSGGLWIGTLDGGLAYRSVGGEWTVYNTENAGLPDNDILALYGDSSGGLWIGTDNGLAYRSVGGEWTVYNTENAGLPDNKVRALYGDSRGRLWIGTYNGGLAYLRAGGQWTVYNTDNAGLPYNGIKALYGDSSGGLWIGINGGGLAHLTFSKKNTLCPDLSDEQCQNLLIGKRAAIIIAGGGSDDSNTLWDSTAAISNYIYKILNKRGFDNDEIYYLSPSSYADFNGDGLDDCIVDAPATPRCRLNTVENPIPERPLNVDDVRQAFVYAKTGGQLDQPLYVFFIDHGAPDKFQLSKDNYLYVDEFKSIIDSYQNETGNQVALVIDTCYSGALLSQLKAPHRAIISSAGDELAYFDRTSKQGFSRFFAKGLIKGMNFWESFEYASAKQKKYVQSINRDQSPQWYDGTEEGQWLKDIFINGDFATADVTFTVEALTTSTTLSVGQSIELRAKTSLAQSETKRLWAIIKPPKVSLILDSYGTPILAFPHVTLYKQLEENVWAATWQKFAYNGTYEITFYAEDKAGNISSSDAITVEVTGGIDSPENSSVSITLAKASYQRGELFKAELTEELGWGYDLYAAVLLPDGHFLALRDTNKAAELNKAKKWVSDRTPHSPVTLLELILPENLPTGQYCLYGILSPENELVLENLPLWVWTQQCFEVF